MKKSFGEIVTDIIAIIFLVCIIFYDYIDEWIGCNFGKTAQKISLLILVTVFILSLIFSSSPYNSNKTPLDNIIGLLGLFGLIALGILALKIFG